MKLSILIATIPERAEMCAALVAFLQAQANGLPVEILTDPAPRGAISIGFKRNALYQRAAGSHAVSIDDDDWVPNDYVRTILAALESDPDCVGHYELVEGVGRWPELAVWTNAAVAWAKGGQAVRYGASYVRTPFHKTPLRTSIALQIPFKDMGLGEDHDFSKRLKASRLVRTEVFIPRALYYYRYRNDEPVGEFGRYGK